MFQNPILMIQKFNEFCNTFSGDPEEQVNSLLASGRMTQKQLNKLQAMASQFMQILNSVQ